MGRDAEHPEKKFCCCQVFPIYHGVYLIALHCVVQATYALSIVFTSYYRHKNNLLLYVTGGSSFLLIPIGILLFWSNLYESWKGARLSSLLVLIEAIMNSIIFVVYFGWFINFNANSQLDKALFWRNNNDWITASDLPFTFWHFFTFYLIPSNSIWFYYAKIISKLSHILREKSS